MPYFGIPIRNGLPIGLGSVAGFGISPFDPSSLFAAGEQGAWYDPSDFSTLFDDSAGVTPVTGVEQFVGLMLDKSKGLVLGSNISLISSATVTTTGNTNLVSSVPATSFYQISFSATGLSASDRIRIAITSPSYTGSYITVDGSYSYILPANAAALIRINRDITSGTVDITNVSVRELPGNHAFQTNSLKRPKLASRYNLLTYTEEFDNAAWTKSNVTVTANAVVAPDGTTTADALFETAANSDHGARTAAGVTVASGVSYKLSFRVKSNGRNYALIYINAPASGRYFDVTPGTAGAVLGNYTGTNLPATITALADNWFLCEVTFTASTTSVLCETYISSAGNNLTYAGDITKGLYLWGADLRPASQATGLIGPTYQRVAAATVYDTAGFLPYLAFDGLSWSMGTNSIDPGAIDKAQVFAGVRKLSDAAQGAVAEFSATIASNNGTFLLAAPNSANDNYNFSSKGTTLVNNTIAGFAAPATNVVTGLGDIAAPTNLLRVNGIQVGVANTSQGTGNYLTYPLFIGARNQASLFFNGWLTSLIVRFGPNMTAAQIDQTEGWIEGKTFGKDMIVTYVDELLAADNDNITAADGDQIYMTTTYT